MGAFSTPGTAAIVMVLATLPPAPAVPAQPAAASTASPDAAASRARAWAARRLRFGSRCPAGSSVIALLARVGIYRTSSGRSLREPVSFLNTGDAAESTLLLPGGPSNVTLHRFFRFVHVLAHVARLAARVALAVTECTR